MKGVPIGDKTEEESGQLTVDDASAAYGVDLIKGKLTPVYKQTEVGVIPEEWEVSFIGDKASKVGSGITPTGGEKIYKPEGRPFLRSQNVGWGQLFLGDPMPSICWDTSEVVLRALVIVIVNSRS